MRIAIFGDIHANLEALTAVLEDASKQCCSDFACTGDLVGYNTNPHECLEVVQKLDCPVVKGNHDEEASLDTDLVGLNPLAERMMKWTRDQLTEEDKSWLSKLRMIRQVRDFTIVHATLDSPEWWGYVTNKFDAMASFGYQYTPVCFFGHTHSPKFYVQTNTVNIEVGPSIRIENGKKYFINVGSVGQPRDGDWRACYAIYDLESGVVTIRRIDYDVGTTQRKIRDSGLPPTSE